MRIAIMQPYFFPFIGYFQLINAVDKFVFYDDVNFIKRGWINRNRIIVNNTVKYITIPLNKASQNKRINEIETCSDYSGVLKTVYMSYKSSPFFDDVYPFISKCLNSNIESISELAINTILSTSKYLKIDTDKFEQSSLKYSNSIELKKEKRLIDICLENKAKTYINPLGGKDLYKKSDFKEYDINLYFIEPNLTNYKQYKNEFIPGLSILDILMFNSVDKIKEMLNDYKLI